MNMTKAMKYSIAAIASTASFFTAAPVMAAENTNTGKQVKTDTTAGFISGLSEKTNKKESNSLNVKTGLVATDEGKVYYDQFGQKVTGLKEIDGKTYYFGEDGIMQTGFQEVDGTKYYFKKDTGEKLTGVIHVGGKAYNLNEDGELLSGWQDTDQGKMYLKEDGYAIKNTTREIDGTRYSFDKDGIMLTNTVSEGYKYDETGAGTPDKTGYQAIADAALAQLGVYQDCTMLVTNSLRAVGINFHGWPEEYLSLGPLTSNPVPGDICVYSGHVAIYIGDGMAVHGGWNGNQTAIFSVQCSNPLIGYVHPILP